MSLGQRIIVFAAIIFAVAALAISLVTLLHERWLKYTVNAATFTVTDKHFEYTSRERGLIWTCVPSGSEVLRTKLSEVKHGRCFEESFAHINGTNEMFLTHLRRSQLGLKSASIFLNLVGLFIGFVYMIMWCLRPKPNSAVYRRVRGHITACWVFAVMLALGAMIIYHYVLDLEKYLTVPKLPRLYVNWEAALKSNTLIDWDVMYYLEWGEIGLLVLALVCMRESVTLFQETYAGGKTGLPDDRTYLYHSNPMMQMSTESLPPYDAYKTGTSGHSGGLHAPQTDDGQSARSAHSTRLPRFGGDSTYDNQAKNVYRIY